MSTRGIPLAFAVLLLACGCGAPNPGTDAAADSGTNTTGDATQVADALDATMDAAARIDATDTVISVMDVVATLDAVDAVDTIAPVDLGAEVLADTRPEAAIVRDAGADRPDVPCTPNCTGRACGLDPVCGRSCGMCASGTSCNASGQCVSTCTPVCSGRACGPDSCGGSCGVCPSGRTCNTSTGQCIAPCTPMCSGRTCGSDGCGGTCGSCGSNATCNASGTCQCNAGFFPSPSRTFCIPPTGACTGTGVGSSGYCADAANWIWCDPVYGLRRMDCAAVGLGGCTTPAGGGGAGACRCVGPTATVTTTGQCGTIGGPPSWDGIYRCNGSFGVIYPVNCRDGNSTGFCTTFATAFGSGPSCMCGPCNPYDTVRRVCLGSPCSAGCAVVPATTTSPGTQACR